METMKQIMYGVTDFARIRAENGYFVDRTALIRELEKTSYAMFLRPRRFGKSLCHAWGASPVYLLGRYYLGVTPTSPGFKTYDVKPNLGGLDWIEGDVPTPWGRIHVYADKNGHKVTEIRD